MIIISTRLDSGKLYETKTRTRTDYVTKINEKKKTKNDWGSHVQAGSAHETKAPDTRVRGELRPRGDGREDVNDPPTHGESVDVGQWHPRRPVEDVQAISDSIVMSKVTESLKENTSSFYTREELYCDGIHCHCDYIYNGILIAFG